MLKNLLPPTLSSLRLVICSREFAHQTVGQRISEERVVHHVYRDLYPWKSKGEFVNHIVDSIFYNEGGLIAFNKPYGVAIESEDKHRSSHSSFTKKRQHISGIGDCPYSIEDSLSEVANCLKVEHLTCVKSAERYASGLTLLACTEDALRSAKKAILRSKPMNVPYITAWIITRGYPAEPTCRERVAMKFVQVGQDEKQVTVVKEFSKRDVLRKQVKPVLVEWSVLAKNTVLSASLMEISTTSVGWHFLRAYPATKAACVLGDPMNRVADVLGKPLPLTPLGGMQILPEAVCNQLKIPKGVEGNRRVPTMVHYRRLALPGYRGQMDFTITNPHLPLHFEWTLKQLQLLPSTIT
ncbi:uncharacterized protein LOC135388738 [Ornithodoros turicata]|uniref:uncharacterized protein LOC135388738 n=1 Tax=Ornithodoros turicata TaxID=34597 RepID=UPI0031392BBF